MQRHLIVAGERVIGAGEQATYRWQRLVGRDGLAREFSAADSRMTALAMVAMSVGIPGFMASIRFLVPTTVLS